MTKKRQKTPLLVKVALFLFSLYAAVTLIRMQMEISEKRTQIEALDSRITAQQTVNDETKDQIENGDKDEYMSKVARDLGYVSPGERVFVDSSSK